MTDTEIGIPEFFEGRHVLVTGATGFMGKVLVEKLVRSCPGIKGVYILIRTKRGQDPQQRLQQIINTPLFSRCREEAEKKVFVVPGDLKLPGLGLSPEWGEELRRTVSIIFHSAATVRFNDPLKESVILNTRGTRELINLALEMPQLAVFVHMSTTYCNTDVPIIEERVYPPHADWRETIRIVETVDDEALKILTPKYLGQGTPRAQPNTYCFAKSLAEHVVADHAHKIPCIIFRPSIVISTDEEPIAGWVDNFNGPVALLVGAGKGIVHVTLADSTIVADYIPVDIAIKALIAAAWDKARESPEQRKEVSVYNCASSSTTPVTMGKLVEMGLSLLKETPVDNMIWVPSGWVTRNPHIFYLAFLFTHLIPAVIIDFALKIAGVKFSLMTIQRKIFTANVALSHFTTNTWKIVNEKILALDPKLLPKDRKDFRFAIVERLPEDFFLKAMLGGRRYLLRERDENIPVAKRNYQRITWIKATTKALLYGALIYWLFSWTSNKLKTL